jgi:hypothetical protein
MTASPISTACTNTAYTMARSLPGLWRSFFGSTLETISKQNDNATGVTQINYKFLFHLRSSS